MIISLLRNVVSPKHASYSIISIYINCSGKYDLDFKNANNDGSLSYTGPEIVGIYKDLCDKYPIISIEDPFDQDDWENYTAFTKAIGDKVQVVGKCSHLSSHYNS